MELSLFVTIWIYSKKIPENIIKLSLCSLIQDLLGKSL
jgi:hypothetical protein